MKAMHVCDPVCTSPGVHVYIHATRFCRAACPDILPHNTHFTMISFLRRRTFGHVVAALPTSTGCQVPQLTRKVYALHNMHSLAHPPHAHPPLLQHALMMHAQTQAHRPVDILAVDHGAFFTCRRVRNCRRRTHRRDAVCFCRETAAAQSQHRLWRPLPRAVFKQCAVGDVAQPPSHFNRANAVRMDDHGPGGTAGQGPQCGQHECSAWAGLR
jgi:hypothetical protein